MSVASGPLERIRQPFECGVYVSNHRCIGSCPVLKGLGPSMAGNREGCYRLRLTVLEARLQHLKEAANIGSHTQGGLIVAAQLLRVNIDVNEVAMQVELL